LGQFRRRKALRPQHGIRSDISKALSFTVKAFANFSILAAGDAAVALGKQGLFALGRGIGILGTAKGWVSLGGRCAMPGARGFCRAEDGMLRESSR
jgi:hypothetical protein